VVGGVVFGLHSQNDANQVSSYQHNLGRSYCYQVSSSFCSTWNSTASDQNQAFYWSTGLYITGGVLAAGAAATWFLWPHRTASHEAARVIAPMVDRDRAGAMLVGTF
jgi:hypothetical protein